MPFFVQVDARGFCRGHKAVIELLVVGFVSCNVCEAVKLSHDWRDGRENRWTLGQVEGKTQ